MSEERWRPLSVRHGSIARRLAWRVRGIRGNVALRLAPWLERLSVRAGPPLGNIIGHERLTDGCAEEPRKVEVAALAADTEPEGEE